MPNPVVRASIHPGLGIARMGNAEEFYIGPQVLAPTPKPQGSYHHDGMLKREAAEFRIYGYDSEGNVVAELTPDNATIQWTAHLAARKANWYKFRAAMDQPGAEDWSLQRRNPDYPADKREDLSIDPGPRNIVGKNASTTFNGEFRYHAHIVPAMIGELRTDGTGRLQVLSGLGVSGSPAGLPVLDQQETDYFGNATGWYDEACDGPVAATVTIDGQEIPCEGAWVVIAPPNYAPDLIGWRSLLDMLEELWQDAGWIDPPGNVSFTRDIYPLLERLSGLQWVNAGFAAFFGPGAPFNFSDPVLIEKLARKHGIGDSYRALRREIFNAFRPKTGDGVSPRSLPWIYGDAFGTLPEAAPNNDLPLWSAAAAKMRKWADGDFLEDWGQVPPQPTAIDDVPLTDQPTMLDRAALHFCVADAFHPGIEVTWPVRHLSMWEKPFRIRVRLTDRPEPDYGDMLTTAQALAGDGPLNAQMPGGLTRWMALPWQADTAWCRSGYSETYDPYLPTFWPVRVPNHVLSAENYMKVIDQSLPAEERVAAFHGRRSWYETLVKYGTDVGTSMVHHFGEMGVVERRDGPTDLQSVPAVLYVETLGAAPAGMVAPAAMAMLEGLPQGASDSEEDRLAQEAGFQNDAQRQFFREVRLAHRLANSSGN